MARGFRWDPFGFGLAQLHDEWAADDVVDLSPSVGPGNASSKPEVISGSKAGPREAWKRQPINRAGEVALEHAARRPISRAGGLPRPSQASGQHQGTSKLTSSVLNGTSRRPATSPRQIGTVEHADHVSEQVANAKRPPAFAFCGQQSTRARTISPSDVARRVATGLLCWLLNKIKSTFR